MSIIKNDLSYELMFGTNKEKQKTITKYKDSKFTKNIMKFYKIKNIK